MDETLAQLVEVFRGEAPELIESINRALIGAETLKTPEERSAGLHAAARAAHNLKGIAATVENEAARDLSHELESVIERLRVEDPAEVQPFFDLGYELCDALGQSVSGDLDPKRLKSLLRRVRGIVANARPITPEAASTAVVPAPPSAIAPAAEPVSSPSQALEPASGKRPVAADPSAGAAEPEVRSSGVRIDERKIERLMAQVAELRLAKIRAEQRLAELRGLRDGLFQAARVARRGSENARRGTSAAKRLTEAVQRAEGALAQIGKSAQTIYAESMRDTVQLSILTDELEGEVRRIMTLPLAAALGPVHRIARDVARSRGKSVRVEISASGIEIDKRMIEELRDPLMHLVRNAVDHGIEAPEERLLQGKNATGLLRVHAEMRGAMLLLAIADDGRGVDRTRVLVAAQEKLGLRLPPDAPYDQVLELLFTPGFSTAAELTDTSGRGVGLDVVRERVRALGGSLRIKSEPGRGTAFELLISPSVSTTRGLLLEVGGQTLAIPVGSVSRVLRISPQRFERIGGVLVFREGEEHGGAPMPVARLDTVLQVQRAQEQDKEPRPDDRVMVLVVAAGDERVAFVTDNVAGEQDMVVKPLPYPVRRLRNLAGAALRGNGEVLPVLSPTDLVASARAVQNAGAEPPRPPARAAPPRQLATRRVLVVDDMLTTRTLEKAILEHAGYRVLVAKSGREAWEVLQQETVDAVVTDVDMPEMSGFELLARVRQSAQIGRLPVVLVTSLSSQEERARGMQLGASAYITKGQFDQGQFLDVIATVI